MLIQGARGAENLERVERASKVNLYGVEKGCPTHWTTLHFVLELLTLKAKYHCLDCSFNDLLRLMGWLLPNPNSVPTNTYAAKKLISLLTMGVEKYNMPKLPFNHWKNAQGVEPADTRLMIVTLTMNPTIEGRRIKGRREGKRRPIIPHRRRTLL